MLNNPTFYRKSSQAPNHRMWMWTVLMLGMGLLATLLVITASANPPSAAEMRLQALVNELSQDRLTARRHDAQRELEAAGEAAVPALTVALRSSDATMRRNAADMLGFVASPASIPALEYVLTHDAVPSVRRNAAWALGNIKSPAPVGALERAAVLDRSDLVRQTALDSLARQQSRLALSAGIDERDLSAYAVSPQDAAIVYVATKRDLRVSENGGIAWQTLQGSLPGLTNVLAVSPDNAQSIYAGVDGLGMFKSVDGGRTWKSINSGLEIQPGARFLVTDVTIDPHDAKRLVIATGVMLGTSKVDFYPTGLYLSTDGGNTWHSIKGNTPTNPVTQLAFEGKQIYALAGKQVLVSPLN